MFTLDDIRAEYNRLDQCCNADTSGIKIVISRRAVKQLGCFSRRNQSLTIRIAASVLHDSVLFYDTIRHEYAHALVYLRAPGEKHGHDEVWKAVCLKVGCIPKRTKKLNQFQQQEQHNAAKYVLQCRNCGKQFYYYRHSKAVMLVETGNSASLRCPACRTNAFTLTRLCTVSDK